MMFWMFLCSFFVVPVKGGNFFSLADESVFNASCTVVSCSDRMSLLLSRFSLMCVNDISCSNELVFQENAIIPDDAESVAQSVYVKVETLFNASDCTPIFESVDEAFSSCVSFARPHDDLESEWARIPGNITLLQQRLMLRPFHPDFVAPNDHMLMMQWRGLTMRLYHSLRRWKEYLMSVVQRCVDDDNQFCVNMVSNQIQVVSKSIEPIFLKTVMRYAFQGFPGLMRVSSYGAPSISDHFLLRMCNESETRPWKMCPKMLFQNWVNNFNISLFLRALEIPASNPSVLEFVFNISAPDSVLCPWGDPWCLAYEEDVDLIGFQASRLVATLSDQHRQAVLDQYDRCWRYCRKKAASALAVLVIDIFRKSSLYEMQNTLRSYCPNASCVAMVDAYRDQLNTHDVSMGLLWKGLSSSIPVEKGFWVSGIIICSLMLLSCIGVVLLGRQKWLDYELRLYALVLLGTIAWTIGRGVFWIILSVTSISGAGSFMYDFEIMFFPSWFATTALALTCSLFVNNWINALHELSILQGSMWKYVGPVVFGLTIMFSIISFSSAIALIILNPTIFDTLHTHDNFIYGELQVLPVAWAALLLVITVVCCLVGLQKMPSHQGVAIWRFVLVIAVDLCGLAVRLAVELSYLDPLIRVINGSDPYVFTINYIVAEVLITVPFIVLCFGVMYSHLKKERPLTKGDFIDSSNSSSRNSVELTEHLLQKYDF